MKMNNTNGRWGSLRIIKAAGLAFVIFTCFACRQQQKEQNVPLMDYILRQYDDGTVIEAGMLQDSMKQGLWVTLGRNGEVVYISFFTNNKRNGPQMSFYEDGTLEIYYEMQNGLLYGKGRQYYSNGQIENEFHCVRGTIDGLVTHYSDNGKVESIHEYRKGKYVRTIAGSEPFAIETE